MDDEFEHWTLHEDPSLQIKNKGENKDSFFDEIPEFDDEYISLFKTFWYYNKNENKYNKNIQNRYNILTGDSINFQYKVLEKLGKGAFSNVYKVNDYKFDSVCALKVIRAEEIYIRQAFVEMNLLIRINHPNCLNVISVLKYLNTYAFILPLYKMTLYELIKNYNMGGIENDAVKMYGKEILQGLSYLNTQDIIHGDLKPENIMLTHNDKIKIIDFGSSFIAKGQIYTYIQSRYYRAPEVTLGLKLTTSIDVWSFICIIFELLTGIPLFKVRNEEMLILRIVEFLNMPRDYLIINSKRKDDFFNYNKLNKEWSLNKKSKMTYEPGDRTITRYSLDNDFMIVCDSVIRWDSIDRCQPDELLKLNYFLS